MENSASTRNWHSLPKWLRKSLIGILIVILVIYTINRIADNPWLHEVVLNTLNKHVLESLDLNIEYSGMNIVLLPPKLRFEGLNVSTLSTKDSLLKASNLELGIDLISLILGQPEASFLRVDELHFDYQLDLTEDPQKPDTNANTSITWPPQKLPIRKVELYKSHIGFSTKNRDYPDTEMNVQLNGADLVFEYETWQDFQIKIDSHKTDFYFLGAHIVQDASLLGDLGMKGSILSGKDLLIDSHDIKGKIATSIRLETKKVTKNRLAQTTLNEAYLDKIIVDSHLELKDSNLTSLGRFLGIEETSGILNGLTRLVFVKPIAQDAEVAWSVTGGTVVQNGLFDGFELFDADASFHVDHRGIDFSSIEISQDGQNKGTLSGTLKFDDTLTYEWDVSLNGMKFRDLLGAMKVQNFDLLDGDLYAEGAKVSGSGKPFNLLTSGNLMVKGLVTPTLDIPRDKFPIPPDCQFNLKIKADSEGLHYHDTPFTCKNPPNPSQNAKPNVHRPHATSSFVLAGSNWFSERGMDLRIATKGMDISLAEYYSQTPMSGSIDLNLNIIGPYENLLLKGSFEGEKVVARGFPLGKVQGDIESVLKDGKILFPQIDVLPESGGNLKLSGLTISTNPEKTTSFEISANDLKPEFFSGGIDQISPNSQLSFGAERLSGKIHGPLFFPILYQGHFAFELRDAKQSSDPLFSRFSGILQLDAEAISSKVLLLQMGTFKSKIKFKYLRKLREALDSRSERLLEQLGGSLQDQLELEWNSQKIPQSEGENLGVIPFVGTHLKNAGISGKSRVEVKITGVLEKLQGVFDYRVEDLMVFGNQVSPFRVKGVLKEDSLTLHELVQGGDSFLGRMHIDLSKPDLPYQWFFRFKNFDVRSLGTKFFFSDPRNYAYISGYWRMKGTFTDWWRSRGVLKMESFRAKMVRDQDGSWKTFDLASEQPIEVLMDESGWNIKDGKHLKISGEDTSFEVFTNKNHPPENLNIKMAGQANLSSIKHFVPKVDLAKGVLVLDGSVTGMVTDVKVDIQLTDKKVDPFDTGSWSPVSVSFAPFPPIIDNLRFRIRMINDRIVVEELSASKGSNGRIEVAGDLITNERTIDPGALNVLLNRVELTRFPIGILQFDLESSGSIILTGNKRPYKISGNLTLDKANSYGNFDIRNQILSSINKRKMNLSLVNQEPNLNLDLHLSANNTIKIRNRNITATLSAELDIKGSEYAPLIVGQIDITEGKFFYKRDFKIRRGTILFTAAAYPPDPKLELVADVTVNQYLIQLNVSGYASDPKVEMTVDPSTHPNGTPINKMEILLLLTQGTLPLADQPGQAATFGKIAQREAANVAVGQFEQPIEKLFDLSGQNVIRKLYLDFILDQNSTLVPRINMPMHFTEDINLVLQLDKNNNVRLSSEYAVHDSISFSWSVDKSTQEDDEATGITNSNSASTSEADSGVDLKFRFNFP